MVGGDVVRDLERDLAGNLVFTSGQIPLNPESGLIEGQNITEQTHRVCKNLEAVLTAAGSSLKKTVKTNTTAITALTRTSSQSKS